MRKGTCKLCSAAIVWIRMFPGKSMPCNETPAYYIERKRGGKKLIVTPNGEILTCEYTDDPDRATGIGYIPHQTTCPHAFRLQKKKGSANGKVDSSRK